MGLFGVGGVANLDDLFLFRGFILDRRGGGLFRRDETGDRTLVPIGERALDVLHALVERAGEPVTRDEIIAAVWPVTVVEDNNLNMQIAALRRALDGGTTTSCIQTIPRRGYRFIAPVARERRPTLPLAQPSALPEPDCADHPLDAKPRPSYLVRRPMIWIGATLMLLAGTAAAWQAKSRWFSGSSEVPRLSIVVLPFTNLASDPAQQYFVDGITEDLTTDLSRLADMLVISRDTAFTYKGEPVSAKRIRRDLNVRYVLEGSVQRSGNEVRINTQLVDTDTDTNLWAARFDRNIPDLLAVQSEITGRIANALTLKLVASEAARSTEHPDVLDHIFRGRAAIYRPATRQNFAEAIAEYQQALMLDPRSVEAQSRLAIALSSRLLDNMSDTIDSDIEQANHLVEQALAVAPESPLAHFAKAQLLRAQHHCEAAIPEYETVLAANHNVLAAIGNIGRCKIYLGLLDDAVALEEHAILLSPRDPFLGVWYFRIGQARLLQSRIDEAIGWLEKAHNENSAYPFVHAWLAAAYGLKGDLPRAAAELTDARKRNGNGSPTSVSAARATSARDFAPGTQALVETTYLAGLRQAGVPEE
jgi:TolB-like protein/DNA-binding winged helix-turn-helix (wHTH) protein